MVGNQECIYRIAMRLCRMWGVAETLRGEMPPYEDPHDSGRLSASEQSVLEWAEEYVNLRDDGGALGDFFERKLRECQVADGGGSEQDSCF